MASRNVSVTGVLFIGSTVHANMLERAPRVGLNPALLGSPMIQPIHASAISPLEDLAQSPSLHRGAHFVMSLGGFAFALHTCHLGSPLASPMAIVLLVPSVIWRIDAPKARLNIPPWAFGSLPGL